MHRYPVLNRFADAAKRRSYLWSFRTSEVVSAFYIGWILTFIPMPTICQMAFAFVMAVLCRANVMILMGLQLLSNTFTFLFFWTITHKAGAAIVSIFGTDVANVLQETVSGGGFTWTLSNCSRVLVHWVATMLVGALTLGSALGFISAMIYKIFAREALRSQKSRRETTP
ncbi:MAG: DUF2062 domain-containing protein [Puniceicoccales bacterium]|jgi:uncharacterized protein (DUF2062 family)|nr:DUF2062 domain-containing protein [Puniceicoccales bacterium]